MAPTPTRVDRASLSTVLSGVRLWALWIATRVVCLLLLVLVDPWAGDDLGYYAHGLAQVADAGTGAALVEYPAHALLVMGVPWLATGGLGAPGAFPVAMVVLLLVLDAAFTGALVRRTRREGLASASLLTWVIGAPLLGATAYSRFDLVPGVLAGAAVLVMTTRRRTAAWLVAAGAAVKLWPAALLLPLLASVRGRRATVLSVALAALVLGGSSLWAVGVARTFSPLTWQSGRGLQIESVAATPAVLAWAFGLDGLTVGKSPYNAYEVAGPGIGVLASASQVATVVAVLVLAWLTVRVWRAGTDARTAALPWLVVSAVLLVMVPSKVLSPQYLLWLLPVAAAAWAVAPASEARPVLAWTRLLLVATALTQVVFPLFYGVLVRDAATAPLVAVALAGRNVLLVVLLVSAVRLVVLRTRSAATPDADPEAAPLCARTSGTTG